MRAATEGGRWVEALEIWDDMQRAGCQPTGEQLCCCWFTDPCAWRFFSGDGSNDVAVLTFMRPSHSCCDAGHAYAAAITACAAGADWQRAVALFESMTSHAGIRPDVVSCTALISALGAAAQADKAEAVVMWMLTTGLKPNVGVTTCLIFC
jgi:pentatricopeptide repeat protein